MKDRENIEKITLANGLNLNTQHILVYFHPFSEFNGDSRRYVFCSRN